MSGHEQPGSSSHSPSSWSSRDSLPESQSASASVSGSPAPRITASSHGSEQSAPRVVSQEANIEVGGSGQDDTSASARSGDADAEGDGVGSGVDSSGTVVVRRRFHFKSRLGCLSCKRRRVKCNEQRPTCSPCRRLGLSCKYPPTQRSVPNNEAISAGSPTWSTALRSTPSSLNLEDLRFYHEFITVAFPTMPLKRPDIWSRAAAMSPDYEHLAHAVLGLGASHISQNTGLDCSAQALRHRVVAIRGFNQQLSQPCQSPLDADALFATAVCLMSQSSLMSDSMADYLVLVRGGHLIASTMLTDDEESIFRGFNGESHAGALTRIVSDIPKDLSVIDGFIASMLPLNPLCRTVCQQRYWDYLYKSSFALRTSSVEAWKEFFMLFMLPSCFSNDEFVAFVGPDNHASQLLLVHMFLLDYMCGAYCIATADLPPNPGRKKRVITWVKNLACSLPQEYLKHLEWPNMYCEVLSQRDARNMMGP